MSVIDYDIAALFVSQYSKNKSSLEYLVSSEVPKIVLLRVYECLQKEEGLTKIEDLPEDLKMNLVNECRETGLKFTNKSLTEAARILHTLKFINQ